jgi:Type I restriction enzyme R protein N terminus (HSDR_N)
MKIPKRVIERFSLIKGFQAIAASHKARDVSEADTVTLIKDILCSVFGFDKYNELTSEQQIRGTFCDLAVKIDGKIRYLIEVKAAAVDLNETHLRQAINYGANQGIEWVVLTNSIEWRLYRIKFGQPISHTLVSQVNLFDLNLRSEDAQERLFLLCREGLTTDAMAAFHNYAKLFNQYTVAQAILSESVLAAARKEIRRLFPEIKVDADQLRDMLTNDVLKRDVVDSENAREAANTIKRINSKAARLQSKMTAPVVQPAEDKA